MARLLLAKYVKHYLSNVTSDSLKEALSKHSLIEQEQLLRTTVQDAGLNAISVAAIQNNLPMLQCLLDPFQPQVRYELIVLGDGMHLAAEKGNSQIIAYMLNSVTAQLREELMILDDNSGKIALHYAIEGRNLEMVKCMRNSMTEDMWYELLKVRCVSRNAALHFAAILNYPDILDFLLNSVRTTAQRFKLLSIQGGGSHLPIDYAAKHQCADAMRSIVESIPKEQLYQLLQRRNRGGNPTLHFAASYGRSETARCLLEQLSADEKFELITMPGQFGATAIHTAAFRGHFETIICMIEMLTPAQWMQLCEHIDIVTLQGRVEQRCSSPGSTELLRWISSVRELYTVFSGIYASRLLLFYIHKKVQPFYFCTINLNRQT